MTRVLQPELLDELPSTDPRAIHSRRDLRRINALMGNARVIARFVRASASARSARADSSRREEFYHPRAQRGSSIVIAEIGAGDGNVISRVARELSAGQIFGRLLLIDRQPTRPPEVAGWSVEVVKSDVFDWLASASRVDVIIANLFLHHFRDEQLAEMLNRSATLCDVFVAAEPRRNGFAEWFARRVKWIGCNDVTRHDAEISVRAGFSGSELSAIWPRDQQWQVVEERAGLFTHFFGAMRLP